MQYLYVSALLLAMSGFHCYLCSMYF